MSNKVTKAERARNLQARFTRIRAAIQVSDELVDAYYEARANEIEAFNKVLAEMTVIPADKPATRN